MIYSLRKIIEFVGCRDSCVEMPELITEPLLYVTSAIVVFCDDQHIGVYPQGSEIGETFQVPQCAFWNLQPLKQCRS